MLVEARINDKGPYHLIFDLGAPVTLLEQSGEREQRGRQGQCTAIVHVWHAGEAEVDKLQSRRANSHKAAGDLSWTIQC